MTVKLTAWRKTFSLKVSICLGNQEIVRNVKIIEDYLRMFLTITVFQSRMFLVITVFQSRMFLLITVFQSRMFLVITVFQSRMFLVITVF